MMAVPSSGVFDSVYRRFLASLSAEESLLLQGCTSPKTFMQKLKEDEAQHRETSYTRRFIDLCQPLVDGLSKFGAALDVLCSIKPEPLALLWGSLRVVLCIADSVKEFFDAISSSLTMLGQNLSRIQLFEELFPQANALQECLQDLYEEILEFFLSTKRLFSNGKDMRKNRLLPRRMRITVRAILSSFDDRSSQHLKRITKHLDRLDREAQASSYQASKDAYIKQDMEISRASQHRTACTISMREQRQERQDQYDWRMLENQFWEEQLKTDRILISAATEESRRILFNWLGPASAVDYHDAALNARCPETCTWILDTPQFNTWARDDIPLLSVYGAPGTGKTILAASVIEHVRANLCPDESLAYHYFDYKDANRQSVQSFLASILTSLMPGNPTYLEIISVKLNNARLAGRTPHANLIRECMEESVNHFGTVFLVVDAVDECSNPEELMSQLRDLARNTNARLKLFVTSRAHTDLHDHMIDIPRVEVEMKAASTQPDILRYIDVEVNSMIQKKRLQLRDPALKQEILSTLSEKANGMFQWAKCQLTQVRSLKTDKAIRNCLVNLPKGLNETYLQSLQRLQQRHDEEDRKQIRRLLIWLVHSARPLNIDEMAEAIAVDLDQEYYDPSAVFTDPRELLKYGESLITFESENETNLQLSHFSVKEFLLSDFCRNHIPEFFLGVPQSNAEIAHVCLTVLLFKEFAIDVDSRICSPEVWKSKVTIGDASHHLYDYAKNHWTHHYHRGGASDSLPQTCAKRLLHQAPLNKNFCFLRSVLGWGTEYLPIHFCAQYGLSDILLFIIQQKTDLQACSEPYGSPLNFAARYDQAVTLEMLLDSGADAEITETGSSTSPGNTCLHWALDDDHVAVVSVKLITVICEMPGVDVNSLRGSRSKNIQRPIHYAAQANRSDLLEILLRNGASIDATNSLGQTALDIAVQEVALDAVAFLLDQGASMSNPDKCGSLKESGFGFFPEICPEPIKESQWNALNLLQQHKPSISPVSTYKHWGLALGEAARLGRLDSLKELLDANIVRVAKSSKSQNDGTTQAIRLNETVLEAGVGTMFSALNIAIHARNFHIVPTLLEIMISVLACQQATLSTASGFDVHNVLIHDRMDSPFAVATWWESRLYIGIVLGYLRLAAIAFSNRVAPSTADLPLSTTGISPELQLVLQCGLSRNFDGQWQGGHCQSSETISSKTDHGNDKKRGEDNTAHFCEQARIIWKAKRNTKNAFHIFFESKAGDDKADAELAKVYILELLALHGFDLCLLDRAGQTLLYWSRVRLWPVLAKKIESLGVKLFACPTSSLQRLRLSIVEIVERLEASHVSTINTAQKSDWDDLGRLLYFAGDTTNACRAFEASAVFDPTVKGPVPAYHYFICDYCHTDYRYDHLLRGRRCIPQGLVNIDLCESCARIFGTAILHVPSAAWLKDQREAFELERAAFEEIDRKYDDITQRDVPKADYRCDAMAKLRDKIWKWTVELLDVWTAEDTEALIRRYRTSQQVYEEWLINANNALMIFAAWGVS